MNTDEKWNTTHYGVSHGLSTASKDRSDNECDPPNMDCDPAVGPGIPVEVGVPVATIPLDTSSDVLITLSVHGHDDSTEPDVEDQSEPVVATLALPSMAAPLDLSPTLEEPPDLHSPVLSPDDPLLMLKSLSEKPVMVTLPAKNHRPLSRVFSDSALSAHVDRHRLARLLPSYDRSLPSPSELSPVSPESTTSQYSPSGYDADADTLVEETPPPSPRKPKYADITWPLSYEEPEIVNRRLRRRYYSDPNPTLLASPGFLKFLRFRKNCTLFQDAPVSNTMLTFVQCVLRARARNLGHTNHCCWDLLDVTA